MNTSKLRGWLLQLPKPTVLRVTVDGDVDEVKLGKSWQKTAETIAAMQPELVQAFDGDNKLLRALRLDDVDARRSDAAELPLVIAQDPHAAMLTHFANLLHRAYEHSTELAFGKMVELVERMNDRSDGIEQRLERSEARARRLQDDAIEDAYAHAEELVANAASQEGEQGTLESMLVNSFMAGQRSAGGKPNGKPANGAAAANGASNGGKS